MTQLEATFSELSEGDVLLLEPGGNFGDHLIYMGLEKALDGLGVDYSAIRRRSIPQGIASYPKLLAARLPVGREYSAVYIHGGSNFNEEWGWGIHLFRIAHRLFDCPIIVGPQSCPPDGTDLESTFAKADNDITFFCREEYSYDILTDIEQNLGNLTVDLSQDTALYLDRSDFEGLDWGERHTVAAFRQDWESSGTSHDIPENIDIESDLSIEADSLHDFANTVAGAKKVYTDRLHVGLMAAILEKPAVLYDNVYYKNRGVYEFSLEEDDNIEFVYTRDEPIAQ